MKISVGSFSECGPHRKENEDSIYVNSEDRLFIIADGLGGLAEGKFASSEAVRLFAREFYPAVDDAENVRSRLEHALSIANQVLFAQAHARQLTLGTTLTAAHIWDTTIDFIHVGDTALWRINTNTKSIDRLTNEHTVERDYIKRGMPSVIASQYRHELTQAVGLSKFISPQIGSLSVSSQDIFVLCSDGFGNCIDPDELLSLACTFLDPMSIARKSKAVVTDKMPRDNFSAIFVRIG